ncbi:P-type conjugative transfer protein TrbJ [Paraburkholderia fungorum]|uniref:P-type conjugative transfer protein TrbJ n=1 Tax=Paraburkholderia fungorum TaxID=134537 RepID=UPI00402BE20F
MKVFTTTLIAGALLMSVTLNARAGAVAGATEPTQILNNIQLTASYAQQAQQTVTQINQYEAMLQNLMTSTPSELLGQAAGALWNDNNMTQTFKNLSTIVQGGQKIAYTLQNTDQLFHNLHPGYGSAFDFQNGYRNWSDNTLSSVQNALSLMNAHASNFANEQTMVKELQTRSQSAVGQMQMLKAGNDIGVAMIGQMQELRQLQSAQIQQQGAFIAAQQSRTDAGDSALTKQFGSLNTGRVKNLTPAQ